MTSITQSKVTTSHIGKIQVMGELLLASSSATSHRGLLGPSTTTRWELCAGEDRERVNVSIDQKVDGKEAYDTTRIGGKDKSGGTGR